MPRAVALATMATASGCGSFAASSNAPRSVTVSGAGAALEFPIYEEVGSHLSAQKITLNYQQTDPAPALAAFRAGQIAFISADGDGTPTGLPRRGTTNAQAVPFARWGVAVIYNLPSVRRHLRLDGRLLADIYSGALQNWNSREIARQNPGVKLPATPIRVVHRAGASVASALLTRYMAAGSSAWRRKVGSGATVRWPGGTPATSDTAMIATVTQNPGAIGYTEQSAALLNGLSTAALRNSGGRFLPPTGAAATSGAYPVLAQAYLLMYRDLCVAGLTPRQASAVRAFAMYVLGQGQAVVKRMWFSPLPVALRVSATRQAADLMCESQQIT